MPGRVDARDHRGTREGRQPDAPESQHRPFGSRPHSVGLIALDKCNAKHYKSPWIISIPLSTRSAPGLGKSPFPPIRH